MLQKFKIYGGDVSVIVNVTDEKKTEVFNAILKWCEVHNCTSGEHLCQNDECNINAPILIADIIDDILDFKIVDRK
jgi:hypothetical protein